MPNEKFKPPYKENKSLSRKPLWNKSRLRLRFEGSYWKQEDEAPFTPKNLVNLFIAYELGTWQKNLNTEFTLKHCLFGSVK